MNKVLIAVLAACASILVVQGILSLIPPLFFGSNAHEETALWLYLGAGTLGFLFRYLTSWRASVAALLGAFVPALGLHFFAGAQGSLWENQPFFAARDLLLLVAIAAFAAAFSWLIPTREEPRSPMRNAEGWR